jgi:hypothetical protein
MLDGKHGEAMARKEQFYSLSTGSLDEKEDWFWLLTGDDGRETIEHEYSYRGAPGFIGEMRRLTPHGPKGGKRRADAI